MNVYEFKLYQMLVHQGKLNIANEIIHNIWKNVK